MIRIAVPVHDGALSAHFGGSAAMSFFDVDPDARRIVARVDAPAPAHEPGVLPRWIAQHRADVVIAGSMGQRAQAMLADSGIRVILGAAVQRAEHAVLAWLEGRLETDPQMCRHDHHHDCHHDHEPPARCGRPEDGSANGQ